MRILLSALLFMVVHCGHANMANPVTEGTLGSRPFLNEHVDIVREDLYITIDSNFQYATFDITYFIRSSGDGVKIPFLFYASDFLDDFLVAVDGNPVDLLDVPDELRVPENTVFEDFSWFFERHERNDYSHVVIWENPGSGFQVRLNDMKYFEADIPPGDHRIHVRYRATQWIDGGKDINVHQFRYALSPASYWRSFGTLNVYLDASAFPLPVMTNLGPPSSGDVNSNASWTFDHLPVEILEIYYQPDPGEAARRLLNFGPEGIATVAAILLVLLHWLWIYLYRKRRPMRNVSVAVIAGSLLVPLIFLATWIAAYYFIADFVGPYISRGYVGYSFLLIIFYPLILPCYWLINWLLDLVLKRAMQKSIKKNGK